MKVSRYHQKLLNRERFNKLMEQSFALAMIREEVYAKAKCGPKYWAVITQQLRNDPNFAGCEINITSVESLNDFYSKVKAECKELLTQI